MESDEKRANIRIQRPQIRKNRHAALRFQLLSKLTVLRGGCRRGEHLLRGLDQKRESKMTLIFSPEHRGHLTEKF